jgi:cytoskeletal protein CcmA (bactofilin family)
MGDSRPGAAGASLVIKGTVTATEDILLSGRVEGSVCVPHHVVTVGPHGRIQAEIEARAVVVGGAVTGNLRATEKVLLDDGARVAGDVRAPRVEMREGAHVDGRIDMPARIRSVTSAA